MRERVVDLTGVKKGISVDLEHEVVRELCEGRRTIDRMVVQAIESKEQILNFRETLEQIRDAVLVGNGILRDAQAAVADLAAAIRDTAERS